MPLMLALRYAYLLGLAIWLGGMIVLGAVVAPALFVALEAGDPVSGRALAGTAFGEILRRFHPITYACGALMLLSLAGEMLLGSRPVRAWVRLGLIGTMLVLSLYSGVWLSAEIEHLQRELQAPVTTLDATHPSCARFDFLHGLSTTLMMLNVAGGLLLTFWEARGRDPESAGGAAAAEGEPPTTPEARA